VAPVYDADGKLLGAFGIDLTLVHLTDFLRNLKPSPNGRSFIVEPDGMLVATSSEEDPYRTETTQANGNSVQQQVRLNAKDSQDPLIRAAADYLNRRFGGFNQIPFPMDVSGQVAPLSFVFTYQGQTELGEVATVNDNRGLNWLIVVVIPANDFMAGVYESIRATVILGACVLVFAAALGSLLSMRIIRPVVTVIEVAAGIEQGKYDLEELDPVTQRTDEMGQLARVFQTMAREVHARERQLQRQVAQLKIEIDEAKRQTEVAQIVDSDVFKNLQERAQRLRERRNQADPNRIG
jgi:sensor histidine kinase YesM